jgi:hypothetical protein
MNSDTECDLFVPMAPDWSVFLWQTSGPSGSPLNGGIEAGIVTHPEGGGGSAYGGELVFSGPVNIGGGLLCASKLDDSTIGLLRWRNATGWSVTLFNVSLSLGISTPSSEQIILPNLVNNAPNYATLFPLGNGHAGVLVKLGSNQPGLSENNLVAGQFSWSGLSVTSASNAVDLGVLGNLVTARPVDTHNVLAVWTTGNPDGSYTRHCGVIDYNGYSVTSFVLPPDPVGIGAAGTMVAYGTRFPVQGNGLWPVPGGYLVTLQSAYQPSPGANAYYWALYFLAMSGATVTSATADPANDGRLAQTTSAASFTPLVLGNGSLFAIISPNLWDPTHVSDLNGIWQLDPSTHQIRSANLGSVVGAAPSGSGGLPKAKAVWPTYDSELRFVALYGADAGSRTVRILEEQISGAGGGFDVTPGRIRKGANVFTRAAQPRDDSKILVTSSGKGSSGVPAGEQMTATSDLATWSFVGANALDTVNDVLRTPDLWVACGRRYLNPPAACIGTSRDGTTWTYAATARYTR